MAIISTSALRKITIFVLAIAFLTFSAAEIHKRFFVPPSQQEQELIPTEQIPEAPIFDPETEENRLALILGKVSSIDSQSFILTTLTDDLQITFSSQTTFYTTSQPGCDIEINPNCEEPIVPSTKEKVLQEGATVTAACEKIGSNRFDAGRVTLVTSL